MINKNNKSLNDLFRSASAETEREVISQSEVERLLQTGKRSVPVTQSIQQQLFERLLSTPLKIGMTAMTTAACITLGLIAFWPQTTTTPATKNPIMTHRTYGSQATDGIAQHFGTLPANKPSFVVSQPTETLPAIAKIPATPIATADSLQPIELSPEQLAKLGIVLEDNGDIDFYIKDKHSVDSNLYISHFSLLPSGGVRMHFRAQQGPITLTELTQQHIIPLAPKLITAANGEKRMFFFENHSRTSLIQNFPNANGKTDVQPVFDDDSELQTIVDSEMNGHRYTVRASAKNPNAKVTTIGDKGSQVTNLSPALQSVPPRTFISYIADNSHVDSGAHYAAKKVIDSLSNQCHCALRIPDIDSIYNSFVEDPQNIEKLTPIHVINTKNAAHPNELIFWYEPTPELTAAMPAAVNPVPTPQSKQLAISVYPNPTAGPATVHYQLSDAPRAYFSMRNLLGQEVLNGGMTSSTTGDANLDLSQLPAGVYLLVTTTDNGERDVERVVVTK